MSNPESLVMGVADYNSSRDVFWKRYQEGALFTCLPACMNRDYIPLGLVGETGEIAEKCKKKIRGDFDDAPELFFAEALKKEIGDLLWYCALSFHLKGVVMPAYTLRVLPKDMLVPMSGISFLYLVKAVVGFIESDFDELSFRYIMEFLSKLSCHFGFTIEEAAVANNNKLLLRYAAGAIRGSGDSR